MFIQFVLIPIPRFWMSVGLLLVVVSSTESVHSESVSALIPLSIRKLCRIYVNYTPCDLMAIMQKSSLILNLKTQK